jgi:ABC-type Na+ efflux pump permease subunit
MLGKLLGIVAVSLTMTTVYLLGAYFALETRRLFAVFPLECHGLVCALSLSRGMDVRFAFYRDRPLQSRT